MTTPITQEIATAYTAAREGIAYYRVPQPGYLRLTGADRRDFIQRQTTNDVRALTPDRALLTVLTNATARVLDVWRLLIEPNGDHEVIGVITLPGRGAATAAYLRTRIFFMDKVTLTDASDEIALFEVFGPGMMDALAALGLPTTPEPDQAVRAEVDDLMVRAVGLRGVIGRGTLLIVAAHQAESLAARLHVAGAVDVPEAVYEVLRVESGLPAGGHELTETFTPLEANLDDAISDAKGCYTGQEIIARQITYDKITRRMAGLRLDRLPAPDAKITVDGRSAGVVTSVVDSPTHGPIALAVIKRPHHAAGTTVQIETSAGPITGDVVALPFEA